MEDYGYLSKPNIRGKERQELTMPLIFNMETVKKTSNGVPKIAKPRLGMFSGRLII
ncbi:hypothetical protein [Polynucleobacter kasalickyi]|uniref:hypothetical protein n=1 Tax=Polynucleobacter kasalickyi TaxID=1938817 RepID=UPI00135A9A90|nr:hypothetical protein [Polynucleobacter kasalickyi]